jgi:hypothetical protein
MDRTLQGHGQHRVQETERRQANQKHNTEKYKEEQLDVKMSSISVHIDSLKKKKQI